MSRQPRRVVRGKRFDAARELDKLLRELGMSVPTWASQHNLDRQLVQNLLAGDVVRPSVAFSLDIQRATEGRVTVEMFGPDTLRDDIPGEVVADESGPLPTIAADADDHLTGS